MEEIDVKQFFSTELLSWYRLNKRDLPWRISRDPYRIWVSEIMLQQTRVDTVIPYFNTFLSKFPTVSALAEAPEEEVLKCWEGLGYYSRARNLQAGAKAVVELYEGIIPDDKLAVSGLRGVGPYTSGAIMSIAFNRPEPAVDGNVMRVLSRYFLLEEDIAKPATRIGIEKLAASLIPVGAAGDFNQALMELGALVCTPKSPGCLTCPVMDHCSARLEGMETVLPIKTKAKPPRPESRAAVIVQGRGPNTGKVLVRQRPNTGLLAQMWEVPHLLVPVDKLGWFSAESPKEQGELAELLGVMLEEDTGLLIRPRAWLMDAEHVFSHIRWTMRVYVSDLGGELDTYSLSTSLSTNVGNTNVNANVANAVARTNIVNINAENIIAAESAELYTVAAQEEGMYPYRWIGPEDMDSLPFPNLFLHILREYWENNQSIS